MLQRLKKLKRNSLVLELTSQEARNVSEGDEISLISQSGDTLARVKIKQIAKGIDAKASVFFGFLEK